MTIQEISNGYLRNPSGTYRPVRVISHHPPTLKDVAACAASNTTCVVVGAAVITAATLYLVNKYS